MGRGAWIYMENDVIRKNQTRTETEGNYMVQEARVNAKNCFHILAEERHRGEIPLRVHRQLYKTLTRAGQRIGQITSNATALGVAARNDLVESTLREGLAANVARKQKRGRNDYRPKDSVVHMGYFSLFWPRWLSFFGEHSSNGISRNRRPSGRRVQIPLMVEWWVGWDSNPGPTA